MARWDSSADMESALERLKKARLQQRAEEDMKNEARASRSVEADMDGNVFERMFENNNESIMEVKQRYSAGVTIGELIAAFDVVGLEKRREGLTSGPRQQQEENGADSGFSQSPRVKQRDDVTPLAGFYERMRMLNDRQIFTVAAGCGKTFTLRLVMDAYNRYCRNRTISHGDAAVALNGVAVHSAFNIVMTNRREDKGLSSSDLNTFRVVFRDMRCVAVDEVSMLSFGRLIQVDIRLREIRPSRMTEPFGRFHVIFCGDLRQLPRLQEATGQCHDYPEISRRDV
ncbi:hypothetical protein HPB50_026327 [Hyalomma asiaticum]|uniref:Uncharacterized protein n=1 Tax=Hyalomma asiaticum TaxID=266040 RepID=A0ACB7SZW2_HYAAI|nr:hypothetical protein HPB50_026327 [Hyalomma asiaticum]